MRQTALLIIDQQVLESSVKARCWVYYERITTAPSSYAKSIERKRGNNLPLGAVQCMISAEKSLDFPILKAKGSGFSQCSVVREK